MTIQLQQEVKQASADTPRAQPKRSWSLGKVALLLFDILLLAGAGYFVVSSGLLHCAPQEFHLKEPQKEVAGSLREGSRVNASPLLSFYEQCLGGYCCGSRSRIKLRAAPVQIAFVHLENFEMSERMGIILAP